GSSESTLSRQKLLRHIHLAQQAESINIDAIAHLKMFCEGSRFKSPVHDQEARELHVLVEECAVIDCRKPLRFCTYLSHGLAIGHNESSLKFGEDNGSPLRLMLITEPIGAEHHRCITKIVDRTT